MMRSIRMVAVLFVFSLLALLPLQAQNQSAVTLTETTITWETVAHEVTPDGAIIPASLDIFETETQTFTAYVLENEYIQATLLPEYGGRILSLIDKTTGYEHLYQNPLGLPYGIGEGNFYYDWLMVYGGIFPTLPGPEHGKAWFLPWSLEVVEDSPEQISVRMSFTDDVAFSGTPGRFNPVPTSLEAAFTVTLSAGERALDTAVTLHNPTDTTIMYEYWTCVTLAPGSLPGETIASGDVEIIVPVDEIKMPPWWPRTIAQEEATGIPDVYTFDALRQFENWADMGIAYAFPTIENANYWGAINQTNREGLIRITDNSVTPGLKIWTWGRDSITLDLADYAIDERRPYIELWAGITPEFFNPAFLSADETITIEERYAVTSGLSGITHASGDALANFTRDGDDLRLAFNVTQPGHTVQVIVTADGEAIYDEIHTAETGVIIISAPTDSQNIAFALLDAENETLLLEGESG